MGRKILFLIALFVACYMSAHFYIRWKNRVDLDSVKTSRLVDCDPNQVRALKIVQKENEKEEELSFERVDVPAPGIPPSVAIAKAVWIQSAPAQNEADTSILNRLASMICEIYDPISVREPELAVSGAKVRRALKLEAAVGAAGQAVSVSTFEFGLVSSDRLNTVRYQAAGNKRMVKISPQLLQLASLPPAQYKNARVLRMNPDDVQYAKVSIDGKERFTLERAGSDWNVLLAQKNLGKGTPEAGRYVNRIATLRALDSQFDASAGAGCAKETHTVTVEIRGVGDDSERVGFDYQKKGDVSACNSTRSAKFKIHRDMVNYLETPVSKLVTR